MQQEKQEDYVLATGITTTILDFVKITFAKLGIQLGFRGKDESEERYVISNASLYKVNLGDVIVRVNPKYY